jgi:uncharacterized membrane protein YfcA
MYFFYFFIAFFATSIGALAGLGGGVIIKPMLDLMNHYDLKTISALSAFTVFAMTCMSLFINTKKGLKIDTSLWYIALGGTLGGFLGKHFFSFFLAGVGDDALAKGFQSILLLLTMAAALVLTDLSLESKHLKNPFVYIATGLFLGTLSTFLGIGGGPLNVAILVTLFSMDRKYAVYSSVFIIFTSQGMRLGMMSILGDLGHLDLKMLFMLIPGAIFGGLLGSRLYYKLHINQIMIVFNLTTISIIFLNIFNAWKFFNLYH